MTQCNEKFQVKLFGQKGTLCGTPRHTAASTTRFFICKFDFAFFFVVVIVFFCQEVARAEGWEMNGTEVCDLKFIKNELKLFF